MATRSDRQSPGSVHRRPLWNSQEEKERDIYRGCCRTRWVLPSSQESRLLVSGKEKAPYACTGHCFVTGVLCSGLRFETIWVKSRRQKS